jgi:hypothetical protein
MAGAGFLSLDSQSQRQKLRICDWEIPRMRFLNFVGFNVRQA